MSDPQRRNSRDSAGDGGSPPVEDRLYEVVTRMEAKLGNDEKFREEVRTGFTDLGTRITRLEGKFDGGVVSVHLCEEREKVTKVRLDTQEKRIDGLVFWLRWFAVGGSLLLLAAVIAVALR